MNIILYTTHCPRCTVLTRKLNAKGIQYIECNDIEQMKNKGIDQVPVLEIDGQLLNFSEANAWVNEQ